MKKPISPLAPALRLTTVLALFVAAAMTGAAATSVNPLTVETANGAVSTALPFDDLAERSHQVVARGGLLANPTQFFCFTGCLTQNDCSDGCRCVHPPRWPGDPSPMPGVCL